MQLKVNAQGISAGIGHRRAFTLVELLVVIGIIAMLISLLMPALSRARDASLAAQCMSNLRQQGIAEQMYMSDSGGFITPYRLPGKYPAVSLPYVFQYLPMLYQTANGATWKCPVDNFFEVFSQTPDARELWPEPISGKFDEPYSYALNYQLPQSARSIYKGPGLFPSQDFNPQLGSKVTAPANTMVLVETWSTAAMGYNSPTEYFRFNHINNTAMNVLFLDGHVESKTPKEILPGNINNPNDTTQWPHGFSAFWWGQEGALGPLQQY